MNERAIAPAFFVAIVGSVGMMLTYGFDGSTPLQGLCLLAAFGGIGVAMILWAKHLMLNEEVEQERHSFASTVEEQELLEERITTEAADVTRRKFLSRMGIAALGTLGLAAIFPLKSLGPNPGNTLFRTNWKRGVRLVTPLDKPVHVNDLPVGGIVTVFPEGMEHQDADATLVMKVPEDEVIPRKGRETWSVQGNIAYSKVCTHVGCPVGLYRDKTHELLCPCHQSTFNVLDGARAIFGPATRSLPQLPLDVDAEGYLVAQSDYREPIGPGFWNRGRKKMEDA